MNLPRVIRWSALLAGISLVSLMAAVLMLPMVVDSDMVKSKARTFIAEKTAGLTSFEKVDIFWFPRPGVVIRDATISFSEENHGQIQQLRILPSIRLLLTGNLSFSRVTADGVAWTLRLPARREVPFNLDEAEENFRAAVNGLAVAFSGMNLRIRHGVADISITGGPTLIIKNFDGDLGVTRDKLDFTISAGGNFADRIRFAGEIATGTLASQAQLSAEKLALRKIIDFYSPGSAEWITEGAATLSFKLNARGLKRFSAEVAGSSASLTLARGARRAVIAAKDFKGIVSGDEKVLRAAVESLPLVSPPLNADGELDFDRSSSTFSIKLAGHDVDAAVIRKTALLLADDVASVQEVFRYVQGGTIGDIHLETRGPSLADAFASKAAVLTASLRTVKMFVPGPNLELENVTGSVVLSAGVLECKKCAATLGKVKGRDGNLRIGISGPKAPFHLDIMVETDARELPALLLRHVKDELFRKEVSRLHNVDGSLSGRLILGETLEAISVKVTVVPAALTVSYEPVQYPISLTGGRINYADGKIDSESLTGAIGLSTFSGLTGSMRADGTGQLTIKLARSRLDLEQSELLLRKVATIQTRLGRESSARGKVDFASITLSGPFNDPSQWNFTGTGKVSGISLKHALLPGAMAIAQGSFTVTDQKLTFADAEVQMLDGGMKGGVVVENWRNGRPLRVQATASGTVRRQMMEWLRRQLAIPANYAPRSPVKFSTGRMVWSDDGNFSYHGKLTVAGGPSLSVDLARHFDSVTVKSLVIEDSGRTARATFDSARDKWSFGFNGTLNKQTWDRIFLTPPVSIGLLQGDFAANANKKPPFRLAARGTLSAKDLVSPVKDGYVVIEQAVVQGDSSGLNIRSADLRWQHSHISLSGKVAAQRQVLQVDLDVASDRLAWDELNAVFAGGDGQGNNAQGNIRAPPLEGIVRLKSASFAVGGLFWKPLQVTAGFSATGITGNVANSVVCGIRTAGSFTVQKNEQIDVDARLSVKDGALESAGHCLSLGKFAISGTYSLDAHLTGHAGRAQLAQTLSGEFDFVARDGKIIRAEPLDATFDYLNGTGDFKVAFPDLDKDAFSYRLVSVKGTLQRQNILAKEIIIEASPYTITAQGSADLGRKTIDGKGLVTVLLPADKVVKSIPLLGPILGGSMVGIPVEVSGALDQPRVSYLSPAALGTELVNIPLRILKAPLDALQILTPGQLGAGKK